LRKSLWNCMVAGYGLKVKVKERAQASAFQFLENRISPVFIHYKRWRMKEPASFDKIRIEI